MPGRVVDTSVAAAIAFGEEEKEAALSLIEGYVVHAPLLLAFELASVARKKAAAHPEAREAALRGLRVALASETQWEEVSQTAVVALAWETGLSSYDATYLHLARSLGLPLVTFDARLRRVAEAIGVETP